MFDRLSKSRAIAGGDGPTPWWVGDLSGAFADLGTFLPLVIALTAVISFGVNVAAGLAAGLIIELARSTVSKFREPAL